MLESIFPPETGFLYIALIGLEFTETIYLPLLLGKFSLFFKCFIILYV